MTNEPKDAIIASTAQWLPATEESDDGYWTRRRRQLAAADTELERLRTEVFERDTLLAELSGRVLQMTGALRDTNEALKGMTEWHGGAHQWDCPMDDTCDCSFKAFNDRVNGAISRADELLEGKVAAAREREI
jgi:hypothetical protein